MAEVKNVNASSVKEGGYILIDDHACVVKSVQKSKTGKHGSAKMRIDAVGLLDNQKRVMMSPASDNVQVPIVEKKTAQVLAIQNDSANVMDMETFETFDIVISEEDKGKVKEGDQVTYWIITDQKVLKLGK